MQLTTQIEEISGVRRRLNVEVAGADVDKVRAEVARRFHHQSKLPGFRKGKAPLHIVERYYSNEIRQEIINRVVPQSFKEAIAELNLEPLGDPNWVKLEYQPGSPLSYSAEFEVLPQFEMGMYKGLEISAAEITVEDKDIEAQLEELRKRNATLEPVEDRAIQEGDYSVIDLRGVELGEDDQELRQIMEEEDLVVHVGDERTHPAFNQALFGMNIAEGKEFDVSYDANYPDQKLAGKKVRFSLEVIDIKQQVLPELNDEFARDLGEYENLEELRSEVADHLARDAARRKDEGVRDQVLEQLRDRTPIEAPQILVENEVDRRIQDYAVRLQSQGVDPLRASIDWSQVRRQLRRNAEKDIQGRLLLLKIAEAEGLEVSSEELDEEKARIAESSNQPLEKISQSFSDPARQQGLREHLLRKKALQLVIDSAKVDFIAEQGSGVE